jgi:hypothetical protein
MDKHFSNAQRNVPNLRLDAIESAQIADGPRLRRVNPGSVATMAKQVLDANQRRIAQGAQIKGWVKWRVGCAAKQA